MELPCNLHNPPREVRISRDGKQVTEIHIRRPMHELSEPGLHRRV